MADGGASELIMLISGLLVAGIVTTLLIASWGQATGCSVDINGDGQVDGGDLGLLIARWGPCN